MLRRCDRYLLREMVGPFFLALAGLVLFILLNIILSLSDLMVDRGIGMATLLKLVVLKMPSLLVIAVPMSALFATFLGLGRLSHDREIVALESIGIPLRRVLLPLILAAAVVGVADFAVYNWVVPASEHAYQQALRDVIYRQGIPRITSNAFFRGPDNQFFYIRRYDEDTGTLHGIQIYDTTSQMFPQADARVTMITAETGRWTGTAWELEAGHVYGFDAEGLLVYSGRFDTLGIPLDQSIEQVLSHSRTPAEMGIAELIQRIAQARETGQRTDEYLVEAHLKISLPLATVVFVLLGGALSLAFDPRSRAAGIIVGLLLVAIFQGVLWYTQTLGRRGAMNATLAAWLPDLVFGAVGLLLYIRVDRLASRDLLHRLRRKIPLLGLFLLLLAVPIQAQDLPLQLTADEVFLSADRTTLRAQGTVRTSFGDTRLEAEILELRQQDDDTWAAQAEGDVSLDVASDLILAADAITATLQTGQGPLVIRTAEAKALSGRSRFVNSVGEDEDLYFQVDSGVVTFDENGEVLRLEANGGEFTTCNCCDLTFPSQPYTVRARRLLLFPGELIVAFGLTARAVGTSVMWLPFYVQPLEETLESPLFPAFGNSALRGWYVKWNVPFFLSERLYGTVLFDLYSRHAEAAVGGVLNYDLGRHTGRVSVYSFPAKVGNPEARFDLQHNIALGSGWKGGGTLSYDAVGDTTDLTYSFDLRGAFDGGDLAVSATRKTVEKDIVVIEERIPELSVALESLRLGGLTLSPRATAGWLREWHDQKLAEERIRVQGGLALGAEAFTFAGLDFDTTASAEASWYGDPSSIPLAWASRQALTGRIHATRGGLHLAWVSTFVRGASPFEFDRVSTSHRLDWTVTRSEALQVALSGSLDLQDGLEPIDLSISWGNTTDWTLRAQFDPVDAAWTEATLGGSWRRYATQIAWSIPYRPPEDRFDDASIDLSVASERAELSFSATVDLNARALESVELDGDLRPFETWGISLGATYRSTAERLLGLRYGLFHDIAECVRLGIERDSGEVWIYASILAFPEAILRYAPERFDLQVGN